MLFCTALAEPSNRSVFTNPPCMDRAAAAKFAGIGASLHGIPSRISSAVEYFNVNMVQDVIPSGISGFGPGNPTAVIFAAGIPNAQVPRGSRGSIPARISSIATMLESPFGNLLNPNETLIPPIPLPETVAFVLIRSLVPVSKPSVHPA